jgi:hypothetical protein
MPRGGAHFGTQELIKVLSCYDIGPVLDMKTLSVGNRKAPKVIIIPGSIRSFNPKLS